jgi:hypothetical protein
MNKRWIDEEAATPGAGVPEVAIYFTRITDLRHREAIHWKRLVKLVHGNDRDGPSDDLRALVSLQKEGPTGLRAYYGNEFCEMRIPERVELEESCAAVREVGLPLTFVTPPASDRGCEMLFDRLTELQNGLPGSEVVVNDWGILHLLHHEFPSLVPVLGRLMNKLLRDPRVTPRYNRPDAPPEALHALQQCSLTISTYRRLLARFGVKRIELDNLYQGVDMDFKGLNLLPSLYIPFGYVTTGRICLLANQHLHRNQKFATPNGPCPRPCLSIEMDLADPLAGADGERSLTQRGNTIFYEQSGPLVSRGLAWAAQQGARLVYQPEVPF